VLESVARRRNLIGYSDLAARVKTVPLTPDSRALHEMLGDISVEEDTGGRGMLSVLVVHKIGDQKPGRGFFELAQRLGRDVSDTDACWVQELQTIYQVHAAKRG
jgi:hypothetical protein